MLIRYLIACTIAEAAAAALFTLAGLIAHYLSDTPLALGAAITIGMSFGARLSILTLCIVDGHHNERLVYISSGFFLSLSFFLTDQFLGKMGATVSPQTFLILLQYVVSGVLVALAVRQGVQVAERISGELRRRKRLRRAA